MKTLLKIKNKLDYQKAEKLLKDLTLSKELTEAKKLELLMIEYSVINSILLKAQQNLLSYINIQGRQKNGMYFTDYNEGLVYVKEITKRTDENNIIVSNYEERYKIQEIIVPLENCILRSNSASEKLKTIIDLIQILQNSIQNFISYNVTETTIDITKVMPLTTENIISYFEKDEKERLSKISKQFKKEKTSKQNVKTEKNKIEEDNIAPSNFVIFSIIIIALISSLYLIGNGNIYKGILTVIIILLIVYIYNRLSNNSYNNDYNNVDDFKNDGHFGL